MCATVLVLMHETIVIIILKKLFGTNRMGGGLELYALEYGSLAGCFENGNSCWFRNAHDVSWLSLEIKADERKLVRAGLVFWLVC